MSLLQRINADRLDARKAKNAEVATLLTTLVGEAEMVGKNKDNRESTDEEVIAVIKKFVKNAEETAEHWNHRNIASQEKRQVFLREIATLGAYLPKQFTAEELTKILNEQYQDVELNPKLKGEMMGFLKSSYPGLYDGKVAAGVVSAILAS